MVQQAGFDSRTGLHQLPAQLRRGGELPPARVAQRPAATARARYACCEVRRGSAWACRPRPHRGFAGPPCPAAVGPCTAPCALAAPAAPPGGAAAPPGPAAAPPSGRAVASREARRWPELPNPLQAVGREGAEAWAARLARTLAAEGLAGFTEELCGALRLAVEAHLGRGAGARCARVEPLVWRLARGEIHDAREPGRGRQFAVSYLEGLRPNEPFHAAEEHPWCAELALHAEAIAQELRESGQSARWVSAGKETCRKMSAPDWKILGLVSYGTWIAGEAFPKTRAALESIRGCCPYEVLFGRMPPHTRIGEHSDNMNFILTAHLGLQLQQGPKCTLSVGDCTRQWARGQVLIFDTSYIHSCVNDTDEDRYVLICRFWHPGCSEEERFALTILQAIMLSLRRHEGAAALFRASHETHGPGAARPAAA